MQIAMMFARKLDLHIHVLLLGIVSQLSISEQKWLWTHLLHEHCATRDATCLGGADLRGCWARRL